MGIIPNRGLNKGFLLTTDSNIGPKPLLKEHDIEGGNIVFSLEKVQAKRFAPFLCTTLQSTEGIYQSEKVGVAAIRHGFSHIYR